MLTQDQPLLLKQVRFLEDEQTHTLYQVEILADDQDQAQHRSIERVLRVPAVQQQLQVCARTTGDRNETISDKTIE
jgi:hypothetical protein